MSELPYTPEQIRQAKAYNLVDILQAYGHQPKKQQGNKIHYLSPFRQEKTASFVVFTDTNKFCDFGNDNKGGALDLVMQFEQCSFIEAVQKLLTDFSFISPKSFTKDLVQASPAKPEKTYTISSIKPLRNTFLLNKVKERGISESLAKAYLKEIYYKAKPEQSKDFFGVCMENESKGYEVKSFLNGAYYCLGPKDISLIDGAFTNYVVFEGMFDFLAFLTWSENQNKGLKANAIILHSVANKDKVLEIVPKESLLFLCLDNDKAGKEATEYLQSHYPNTKTLNHLYKNHKDFNLYFVKIVENCRKKTPLR
ncbi:MAG: toprim domain-containing protein [Thermonemataceae bacterium]|nr:toprim domain-containing protein [Thermonemataceae bacterium]